MADRIEREIEEILKKIDNFPERSSRPKGRKPGGPPKPAGGLFKWLSSVSMRKVMMWALFAAIVAFFFRGVPGGYWLLIGAIIVFATAFILSTRGGSSPSSTPEKRWRGQPLDLSEPSWPDKFKAWWKGRRRN